MKCYSFRDAFKRILLRAAYVILASMSFGKMEPAMAEADLRDPETLFIDTVRDMGRGLVVTEAAAVAIAEAIVRHYHGDAEFEAQLPLQVIGDGFTADGTPYWWVEGTKTELSDRDFLGFPMRVRLAIGKVDGRVLDMHFHHPDMVAPALSEPPTLPPNPDDAGTGADDR